MGPSRHQLLGEPAPPIRIGTPRAPDPVPAPPVQARAQAAPAQAGAKQEPAPAPSAPAERPRGIRGLLARILG